MAAHERPADSVQRWAVQLRKGVLELAILAALWPGRLYGLEILRRLADGSNLVVPEGTVYPLLSRLRDEGWVDSEWVVSDAGHPRRYYTLTPRGRRHVRRLAECWSGFAASLDHVLKPVRKEEE